MKKSLRFKIFQRDSFTCQYCGAKPPDVLLHVDHMISKKDGGGDEDENLITSCKDCNLGKSARSISSKERRLTYKQETKELEEKMAQLQAYYDFRAKRTDFNNLVLNKIQEHWQTCSEGGSLTEAGLQNIQKLLKTYRFEEIIEAISLCFERDIDYDRRFKYFCGILKQNKLKKDNPEKAKRLELGYKFRYKLLNNFHYVNEKMYWKFINDGVTEEELQEAFDASNNWTEFKDYILTNYYQ